MSLSVCSYRFMDMFPDTALIRGIQRELDDIIQQGVQNITRLIRATDTTTTNPVRTQSSRSGQWTGSSGAAVGQYLTSSRAPRGQRDSGEMTDSSLANRLVRDGLLTPDLLRQLQREFSKDQKEDSTNQEVLDTEQHNNNNKGKKRRKKWRGYISAVATDPTWIICGGLKWIMTVNVNLWGIITSF